MEYTASAPISAFKAHMIWTILSSPIGRGSLRSVKTTPSLFHLFITLPFPAIFGLRLLPIGVMNSLSIVIFLFLNQIQKGPALSFYSLFKEDLYQSLPFALFSSSLLRI